MKWFTWAARYRRMTWIVVPALALLVTAAFALTAGVDRGGPEQVDKQNLPAAEALPSDASAESMPFTTCGPGCTHTSH